MITYGWTIDDIHAAVTYVNKRYELKNGTPVVVNNAEVKSQKCRRGEQTLSFRLGFGGSVARRKDGNYGPGVKYTLGYRFEFNDDVIPYTEFGIRDFTYINGKRVEKVQWKRSNGSLCWHTYGHVMVYLFNINPGGKIRRWATYDGQNDFLCKAARNKGGGECECEGHGLNNFFEVRDD